MLKNFEEKHVPRSCSTHRLSSDGERLPPPGERCNDATEQILWDFHGAPLSDFTKLLFKNVLNLFCMSDHLDHLDLETSL